jgi:predicted nucleotidyltransferase
MRREVWLYGSVARGMDTPISDLDLLVAPQLGPQEVPEVAKLVRALPQSDRRSITVYSWEQLTAMAAYGSLFLVHLRSEARLLYGRGSGRGLAQVVETLPPYSRADHDLWGFAQTLADVDESLRSGGDPSYELGVVATVVRHCSILATYLGGTPVFDRERSISTAFALVGQERAVPAALKLHAYRMARLGRLNVAEAGIEVALGLTHMARNFVEEVKNSYGSG